MQVVLGATGFLGRRVVAALVARGESVRAVARRATNTNSSEIRGSGVERRDADATDPFSLERALVDASGVVNAISLYVERGGQTFESLHVETAGRVAATAARLGASRLVHVSGIGADGRSRSAYVSSRARGEAAVREAFPEAVVVRPSVIFGEDDALLSGIEAATRSLPVFPLFGSGDTRLQPVYVADVAEAIARMLTMPEAPADTYELGGPEVLSYRTLVTRILDAHRRGRVLLPIPFFAWRILARSMSALPAAPITVDQVELMRGDNVVGAEVATLESLGIEATGIDAVLDELSSGSARS